MKLRTHRKLPKEIITTEGKIAYSRYVLRPDGAEAAKKLKELENRSTVVPLDIVLGVSGLPFKITVQMMIEICYWAAKAGSYQDAEEFIRRAKGIDLSDDTIRKVVNHIGGIVFEEDCRLAKESAEALDHGTFPCSYDKSGILYIQTDGAALNTRTKDQNDSTWRENKLGLAFSSDHIYFWKNSRGEMQHRIQEREYISYIGPVQEFKYHLYALAMRAGYGTYKETVILSDGATWIRNIKDELFPDAQQILDLFHLKENTYSFAKEIFHNDKSKYELWAKDICSRLEEGKWKDVLKDLDKYKSLPPKQGFVNLHTYITNNKNNIDYPTYKKKGYFVGSGAIESGNKIVLQNRLKLPGMRWNVSTAQCMISLKAKLESNRWETEVVPLVMRKMNARL